MSKLSPLQYLRPAVASGLAPVGAAAYWHIPIDAADADKFTGAITPAANAGTPTPDYGMDQSQL